MKPGYKGWLEQGLPSQKFYVEVSAPAEGEE
jgi:hypothetical protein